MNKTIKSILSMVAKAIVHVPAVVAAIIATAIYYICFKGTINYRLLEVFSFGVFYFSYKIVLFKFCSFLRKIL